MVKIRSEAIGKGSGSMGNITYRYTNGQTIASSRIWRNRSNTPAQQQQRDVFKKMSRLAKALHALLKIGFAHEAGGRTNNLFMHYNTALMEYIKTYPGFNNHLPAITNLCIALSDPEFGAKIMVANGTIEHTVTYEWGPGPSIEGKIHASRKFMAGDVVSLGLCYSYMLVGSFFGMTEVYSRKLTKEDVKNLSYPNHFPINGEMFPEMDVFGVLPPGFSDVEILAAAIVTGENDSSQSFLAPMPDMKPEYQVVSQSFDDDTHMRLVVDYPEAFVNETGLLALHCVMMYLADIENKIDREFKVEALSQDAAGNVNGIIVSPPNNYTYMTGDYSTEEGEVCVLVEGDEVIAFLNGVAEVVMMG